MRVQPWAKITRGRAVFVIPGLKERDAANNYNCICSVFPQCLSVFSCHTSNIYYHFIISSRSTCLPETSKMCSLQILGLNPTNIFTCHAGPVLHQSRCDVSLENGDGRWNPGRPFSTMLTVISMQSFLSVCVSSFVGICLNVRAPVSWHKSEQRNGNFEVPSSILWFPSPTKLSHVCHQPALRVATSQDERWCQVQFNFLVLILNISKCVWLFLD